MHSFSMEWPFSILLHWDFTEQSLEKVIEMRIKWGYKLFSFMSSGGWERSRNSLHCLYFSPWGDAAWHRWTWNIILILSGFFFDWNIHSFFFDYFSHCYFFLLEWRHCLALLLHSDWITSCSLISGSQKRRFESIGCELYFVQIWRLSKVKREPPISSGCLGICIFRRESLSSFWILACFSLLDFFLNYPLLLNKSLFHFL